MSEPHEIADRVEPVVDGVWHWRISNSNLGGATSSSRSRAALVPVKSPTAAHGW